MEVLSREFDPSENVKDGCLKKSGEYILHGPGTNRQQQQQLDHETLSPVESPRESTPQEATLNLEPDWILVDSTELQKLPLHRLSDEEQQLNVTAAAATAGAAGLLLMGPIMTSAIVAAGTIGYCADPDRVMRSVQWVQHSTPQSLAECKEVGSKAADVLAGRAKQAVVVGRRVYSALSGKAIDERDQTIENLRKALATSSEIAEAEKYKLNAEFSVTLKAHAEATARLKSNMADVENRWRDQSTYLNSQLADTEQAHAEERERLRKDLEAARLAKDEEVVRLANMLEAAERTLARDTERLTAELEHHRRERVAEKARLLADVEESQQAQKVELLQLQKQLVEAEIAKALEAEDHRRAATALEHAIRQKEEESETKRCTICMDRDRQILFLPCRHVACCKECAAQLQNCPIDRSVIVEQIELIVS